MKAAAAQTSGGGMADAISVRMPELVKGKRVGADSDAQAATAEHLFKTAIKTGFSNPGQVLKGLSPQFGGALNMALQGSPQNQAMAQLVSQMQTLLSAELGKNISLTTPLNSGLVPFDLVAPTRLIYPVYSPFRNMVPRVPGQGTSHRGKVMTSISGALPGQLGVSSNRMSIPELPAGGGLAGSNWPNQLPASGSQAAEDLNIPYRFFGLTEAVSWLAQFAGQGFEDAAGLASLVLLQEAMLLEERAMIGATATALATPAAPTLSVIASGGSWAAASPGAYVKVTALNYYGETAASAEVSVNTTANCVVRVQISPVPGALAYNVYAGATAGSEKLVGTYGGTTIDVLAPGTGVVAPNADSGTAASTDYEGFASVISGHAGTAGVYPADFKGSYINQAISTVLSADVINTALEAMWDGARGIFADPDDLWCEGTDATNLSTSLADDSGNTNYRLFIQQSEVAGIKAGVAVSEFTNPITRKTVNIKVHPYFPQGTAMLLSWKLPQPWSNVGNVWENVMVQDYLSISWPVVDVTFRYSLFFYGTLFSPAVQYNGLLQGLQRTDGGTSTNGYS